MNPEICAPDPKSARALAALILTSLAISLVMSGVARGNDSAAGFSNNELVLQTDDDIEMKSERLYISPLKITVDYEFENKSDQDISRIVAFPMPKIAHSPSWLCGPRNPPPRHFTVSADGIAITPSVEEKATSAGMDVTKKLRDNHIKLQPLDYFEAQNSEATEKFLLKNGLLIKDDCEGEAKLFPFWDYQKTYYWRQSFPARSIVRIRHAYKPSLKYTGAGVSKDYLGQFDACVDQSLMKSLDRIAQSSATYQVEYVLTTGGNWKGRNIKDFNLVVDKLDPKNFVSFCGENVKKISATQFEMRKIDFYPTKNLSILFFGLIEGAD